MDFEAFKASLAGAAPPAGMSRALAALWHAAKGDWGTAHALAQAEDDLSGAWVHAYLHRVEGDQDNAGYWYRWAGRPHCRLLLDAEWEQIARSLLDAPQTPIGTR
ncbi:MAG TPA: hypothetical protein VF342_12315 [Alphaproteobacteria bacterium]